MVTDELPARLNPLKEWVGAFVQGSYPIAVSVRTLMAAVAVDKLLLPHDRGLDKVYCTNNVRASLKALVVEGKLTARKLSGGRGMRYTWRVSE